MTAHDGLADPIYEHTDVPPGMTLGEYRRIRAAARPPRRRRRLRRRLLRRSRATR